MNASREYNGGVRDRQAFLTVEISIVAIGDMRFVDDMRNPSCGKSQNHVNRGYVRSSRRLLPPASADEVMFFAGLAPMDVCRHAEEDAWIRTRWIGSFFTPRSVHSAANAIVASVLRKLQFTQ
jgi:hypothetical protein